MIACCELCYKKYITKSGKIDYVRVGKYLRESRIEGCSNRESIEKFMEDPCTCECHEDGSPIRH